MIPLEQMRRCAVRARGATGLLRDVLFTEGTWTVRHVVVGGLEGVASGQSLVPASAVEAREEDGKLIFAIDMSPDELEHSSDPRAAAPVSVDEAGRRVDHHGWPHTKASSMVPPSAANDSDQVPQPHPSLRSARGVYHLKLRGPDGKSFGRVHDVIIDEKSWRVPAFVVATRRWFGGVGRMLESEHVKTIDWQKREVVVDLTRSRIDEKPLAADWWKREGDHVRDRG